MKARKFLSLGCALALALSLAACGQQADPEKTTFGGGSGTEADPYQIASAGQLDAVRENLSAHYLLTADIDLADVENWTPIGGYDMTKAEDDPEALAGAFSGI